jgi:hypothetical protein
LRTHTTARDPTPFTNYSSGDPHTKNIQRDRDRVRNAQTQLVEQPEENQELVAYAETERSIRDSFTKVFEDSISAH